MTSCAADDIASARLCLLGSDAEQQVQTLGVLICQLYDPDACQRMVRGGIIPAACQLLERTSGQGGGSRRDERLRGRSGRGNLLPTARELSVWQLALGLLCSLFVNEPDARKPLAALHGTLLPEAVRALQARGLHGGESAINAAAALYVMVQHSAEPCQASTAAGAVPAQLSCDAGGGWRNADGHCRARPSAVGGRHCSRCPASSACQVEDQRRRGTGCRSAFCGCPGSALPRQSRSRRVRSCPCAAGCQRIRR